MPLDSNFNNDGFKSHCIGWQLTTSFLPRRCFYSRKLLWFKKSYKGTAMWTGPGDPIFESRWVEKNYFLIKRITGEI